MESKKTIKDWELEKGFIVRGAQPMTKLTEQEFDDIPAGEKVGVNHKDRVQFLKDNGYEVTRENMINVDLGAKSA